MSKTVAVEDCLVSYFFVLIQILSYYNLTLILRSFSQCILGCHVHLLISMLNIVTAHKMLSTNSPQNEKKAYGSDVVMIM